MKKILEEINRNKELMNIAEADISGIDELVFNPVTKSSGEIGHGYKKGVKIQGLTWKNHDDHLHISFTNKNVAMAVIDMADKIGLVTTENPYAKKDPTGKIERVHTQTSHHYETFEGSPLVGKAVDISGDKNKIVQLIKWIEKKYGGEASLFSDDERLFKPIDNPKTEEEKKYNELLNLPYDDGVVGDIMSLDDIDVEEKGFFELLFDMLSAFK